MTSGDTSDPTTARDGTVEEVDGHYVLRFERRLDHPIDRVWAALTEPEQLAEWLAEAEIDLVEGGRVALRWQNEISDEERLRHDIDLDGHKEAVGEEQSADTAESHGSITRLDPPRLLEYDSNIHGVLRWELREDGSGCVLTLTSTLPALPDHLAAQTLAGWHIHLDLLAEALAGHPTDWPNWPIARWAELRDRYAATPS